MSTPADITELNTESILKSVCGTAANGQTNSCQHDHSAQAKAMVRQIRIGVLRDLVGVHGRELTVENIRAWANELEAETLA